MTNINISVAVKRRRDNKMVEPINIDIIFEILFQWLNPGTKTFNTKSSPSFLTKFHLYHVTRKTLQTKVKRFLSFWIFGTEWTFSFAQRCSVKKVFLEISQNPQESTCARVSFLIKTQVRNFIKIESLAQVLSCEFC